MIIDLKDWQKNMVSELRDALPVSVRGPLSATVLKMAYIEKQTGDGFYKDNVAYISRGIRHPRLMAERTCHEWGHGIEEWLAGRGIRIPSGNSERMADGFALSVLYPRILESAAWRSVGNIYRQVFYPDGFPDIGTEALIEKYVRILKRRAVLEKRTMDREVHRRLEDFFNVQSAGFLRRKWAA